MRLLLVCVICLSVIPAKAAIQSNHVSDLPLTEVPAAHSASQTLALFLTGDSGERVDRRALAGVHHGRPNRVVQPPERLEKRPDVDPKRIAVAGHGEGAWIGLLAASREKRIAAVVSIAGPSTTGVETVLEQQRLELEGLKLPAEEREKRIALQQQVNSAVLTGKGWENVPPQVRKEADTPWFQSLLTFDPTKVLDDVRQPMLFVHGALDRQVPVEHVERLADIARKESKSNAVEVVVVRGVNHLLVPAITGEANEYGTLPDRNVSKDVTMATTDWLKKTFAAIR